MGEAAHRMHEAAHPGEHPGSSRLRPAGGAARTPQPASIAQPAHELAARRFRTHHCHSALAVWLGSPLRAAA